MQKSTNKSRRRRNRGRKKKRNWLSSLTNRRKGLKGNEGEKEERIANRKNANQFS